MPLCEPPSDVEVARLLAAVRGRIIRLLRRHDIDLEGRLDDQHSDPLQLDSPLLAQLQGASVGDIRKVSLWLGHAQQSTTEIYLHIDPTEKIAALESSVPIRLRPGRFQPADRLLASLMPSKMPSPHAPG